jgi:hypothetical protein
MPMARIVVTAVTDEGDIVVVWGRPEQAAEDSQPVGFAFHAKGERADVALAARASRLVSGTAAVIEYASVTDGWSIASGLAVAVED